MTLEREEEQLKYTRQRIESNLESTYLAWDNNLTEAMI